MNKSRVHHAPLSPLCFLERAAKVYKHKIAISSKDLTLTYQELADSCDLLSRSLARLGAHPGDKIAFLSRNNPVMIMGHYAVPHLGGVLVTINFRLAESDIHYILQHSETKILVVEKDLLKESFSWYVDKIIVINAGKADMVHDKYYDYDQLMDASQKVSPALPKYQLSEDDTIAINYTSGTTGRPKGVMYSHRGAYLNALGECLIAGINNQSRYLWVLPMFHCNGWCYTWALTAVGATHYCINSNEATQIIEAIIAQQISHFCAAPTVLIKMQQSGNLEQLRVLPQLTVITAGAAPPPVVIDDYQCHGIKVTHVYGLTETYGPHLVCEELPEWQHLNSKDKSRLISRQGVPGLHSLYVEVIDENGCPVEQDGKTLGEIVMKGNNVMKGYYKDPELTEEAFRGGWFHSGDLGVVHSDGYIEVKDRKKDIIISGGENIASLEIETVLYEHPDVLMVAVIPVFDETWGEVPKAIIELKPNRKLSAQEVIAFCKERLARYKCPKRVIFESLPRNSTGKIQKNKLKTKYYYSNQSQKNYQNEQYSNN